MGEPIAELAEASMNFDAELVAPFVERLSSLVTGLAAPQIAQVVDAIEDLGIDEERELIFEVLHQRRAVRLKIRVGMDDVDAPDLYFFTTRELAAEITNVMADFCEEHGI